MTIPTDTARRIVEDVFQESDLHDAVRLRVADSEAHPDRIVCLCGTVNHRAVVGAVASCDRCSRQWVLVMARPDDAARARGEKAVLRRVLLPVVPVGDAENERDSLSGLVVGGEA